jgi:hypothetical protein
MSDDDRDLREHFARQRSEEARDAPGFAQVWAAAQERGRRPRRGRLTLLTAGAVAAAVAMLLLWRPSPPPPPPSASASPSLGRWRAPTDFLLQTPGRELLSGLPAFGRGWPGPRDPSPKPERSTSS